MSTNKIIFGAGCFWGVEAAFRRNKGVTNVTCGYSGGHTVHPTYAAVCSGTTGHIEVVLVEYDDDKISFEALLNEFWNCHDPTTQDRQGFDIGEQYRSVIFYFTPEQERLARESKDKLEISRRWRDPIVTQILPASQFYDAEEYHQNYFAKRGGVFK
ncbi:peptide-methionine (S)-S-oxide reductase [Nitrosomonas ureae]|uniref:Peptide methionine sulfoxide reductase MsrA n=1 Tax=Nitrosomonas ureae TaxID=44577 RepID=A0A286AFW2_9PROT|nr:peptide-methionine (S)-S-oxide reductase MsrA [Nitrosomonas ureae]PXX14678.1 peptide-methionine (S)-S-oxide reductase [Nitrosomonas ureae]SOD20785.1 peptide-methionine (S)-S-oxide reductase [Nitrosomonas ureae]